MSEQTDKYVRDLTEAAEADGMSPLQRLLGERGGGMRPIKIIPFPGRLGKPPPDGEGISVGLWSLSVQETRQARIDARKVLRSKPWELDEMTLVGEWGAQLLEEETRMQVLARAVRNAEQPMIPFASGTGEMNLLLEPDERDALLSEYAVFLSERSPLAHLNTDEEVDKLAGEIVGKAEAAGTLLSHFDTASLRRIITQLADRLARLMRQSFSGSSALNESSGSSTSSARASTSDEMSEAERSTIYSETPTSEASSAPSSGGGGERGGGS